MLRPVVALIFASSVAFAQNPNLAAPATLPVTFAKTVSANHAKVGDPVEARTIQRVLLPGGASIPSGARVLGHVVNANGFSYDKTPYALDSQRSLRLHPGERACRAVKRHCESHCDSDCNVGRANATS
jgi:hypothetical protein